MTLTVPLDSPEAADPERFGPKAANLARLAQAGLPTPGGACIDAQAYRAQVEHLGLCAAAREAASADLLLARRRALEVRMGLFQQPIAVPVLEAWEALEGVAAAVRSSALVEDRAGASFAGQFESYLGVGSEPDYLTAVRACWAALWSVRALRYFALQEIDPAQNAMALLVQPFVAARAAGGGLSRTPGGEMLLTAAPGPGSAIAQGEVVPDRYLLDRDAVVLEAEAGRSQTAAGCAHERALPRARSACLDRSQASALGSLLLRAEQLLAHPVEIEWVLGANGFQLVQARPLRVEAAVAVAEPWPSDRVLRGQPAGIGRATGRSCVIRCECARRDPPHSRWRGSDRRWHSRKRALAKEAACPTERRSS